MLKSLFSTCMLLVFLSGLGSWFSVEEFEETFNSRVSAENYTDWDGDGDFDFDLEESEEGLKGSVKKIQFFSLNLLNLLAPLTFSSNMTPTVSILISQNVFKDFFRPPSV